MTALSQKTSGNRYKPRLLVFFSFGLWRFRSALHFVFIIAVLMGVAQSAQTQNSQAQSAAVPDWLSQGYADLQAGRYAEATRRFQAAAQAEPQNSTAAFFAGISLNRLGNHRAALEHLARITPGETAPPELAFERGWALLGTEQWDKAIAALETYEKTSPGRGQTSEFLGRAYFGLKQWEQAETLLREAIKRDERLGASATYYLAQIAERRGQKQQAGELWAALARDFPNSPLSRAARGGIGSITGGLDDVTGGMAPETTGASYEFLVSAGGGYNSNVIALGDGIPLPTDISRRSSSQVNFALGAAYKKAPITGGGAWRLGYDFVADTYPSVQGANLQAHLLSFDYGAPLSKRLKNWTGGLRLADQLTFIGGSRFSNQIMLRPALAYRHDDQAATELAYGLTLASYAFATPAVQDRDGTNHVLGLTHFRRHKRWQWRAGVFHVFNQAQGADFDFDADGLLLGGSHPLGKQTMMNFVLSHTRERYDNPNSANGFTARRRDNRSALVLQLTHSLNDKASLYAQYGFNRAGSNIAAFDYDQHIVSGGINYRF